MEPHGFILTYWDLRGTTQAIRNLLEYLEVSYEDRSIETPKEEPVDFLKILDNPQMPNLKHGSF